MESISDEDLLDLDSYLNLDINIDNVAAHEYIDDFSVPWRQRVREKMSSRDSKISSLTQPSSLLHEASPISASAATESLSSDVASLEIRTSPALNKQTHGKDVNHPKSLPIHRAYERKPLSYLLEARQQRSDNVLKEARSLLNEWASKPEISDFSLGLDLDIELDQLAVDIGATSCSIQRNRKAIDRDYETEDLPLKQRGKKEKIEKKIVNTTKRTKTTGGLFGLLDTHHKHEISENKNEEMDKSSSLEPFDLRTNPKEFKKMIYEYHATDNTEQVHGILMEMMDTKIDAPTDIGMEKKRIRAKNNSKSRKDPLKSMRERQEQAKKRREQREKARQKAIKDHAESKEKRRLADQMKRQKDKQLQAERKLESKRIALKKVRLEKEANRLARKQQLEMIKIREEEKTTTEILAKEQAEIKEAEELAKNLQADLTAKQEDAKRKRIKVNDRNKELRRLKILHTHFSAWYGLVTIRREKKQRVKCVLEFKIKVRAFNAWQSFCREKQQQREARIVAEELACQRHNELKATQYHDTLIITKAFFALKRYAILKSRERIRKEKELLKKQKMALLLASAAVADANSSHKQGYLVNEKDNEKRNLNFEIHKHSAGFNIKKRDDSCMNNVVATQREEIMELVKENILSVEEALLLIGKISESSTTVVNEPPDKNAKMKKPACSINREKNINSTKQKGTHPSGRDEEIEGENILAQSSLGKQIVRKLKKSSKPIQAKEKSPIYVPPPTPTTIPKKTAFKPPPKPQNIIDMERRAAKIKKLRDARIERQKIAEAERQARIERQRQEEEAAKQAAKQELIAKKREERRLAREQEELKQRKREEAAKNRSIAINHYNTACLRHRGLEPWKKFMRLSSLREKTAVEHYSKHIQAKCIYSWGQFTIKLNKEKKELAVSFYRRILMRRSLLSFKQIHANKVSMIEKATVHHSNRLGKSIMSSWWRVTLEGRKENAVREKRARMLYEMALVRKALRGLSKYPSIARQEREKEVRRQALRSKVKGWLPDFKS
eukprot:UC4_evm9s1434